MQIYSKEYLEDLEKRCEEANIAAFELNVELVKPYKWSSQSVQMAENWLAGKLIFADVNHCRPTLESLAESHRKWTAKAFPKATATSSLDKCREELSEIKAELAKTISDPTEEYADALMCLLDSAARQGVMLENITKAFEQKLKVNQERKWQYNGDGTYSHIKEGDLEEESENNDKYIIIHPEIEEYSALQTMIEFYFDTINIQCTDELSFVRRLYTICDKELKRGSVCSPLGIRVPDQFEYLDKVIDHWELHSPVSLRGLYKLQERIEEAKNKA